MPRDLRRRLDCLEKVWPAPPAPPSAEEVAEVNQRWALLTTEERAELEDIARRLGANGRVGGPPDLAPLGCWRIYRGSVLLAKLHDQPLPEPGSWEAEYRVTYWETRWLYCGCAGCAATRADCAARGEPAERPPASGAWRWAWTPDGPRRVPAPAPDPAPPRESPPDGRSRSPDGPTCTTLPQVDANQPTTEGASP